jgi:uncharacterized phiE125 gp8 family phage protein
MRQIKVNSTTGNEIISVQDVKNYARIDTSADDTLIVLMIETARVWCENYISRDIVPKNRTYYLDTTTTGLIDIPFAPVASIESITINDEAATYTILGLDNETIELDGGAAEKVKITYITNGINNSLVKQAILQTVSTYYDNRTNFISDQGQTLNVIPTDAKNILISYKTMFV